jgi:hypothetical protein
MAFLRVLIDCFFLFVGVLHYEINPREPNAAAFPAETMTVTDGVGVLAAQVSTQALLIQRHDSIVK